MFDNITSEAGQVFKDATRCILEIDGGCYIVTFFCGGPYMDSQIMQDFYIY